MYGLLAICITMSLRNRRFKNIYTVVYKTYILLDHCILHRKYQDISH